jgi:nucleotide-binding universal stress UspA family protein
MFERIVVAVDTSDHAKRTLDASYELAQLSGGEARVLHVREGRFIGRAGVIADEGRSEAHQIVEEAVAHLIAGGVKATGSVRASLSGRVAAEILSEAADFNASVIVMGSRGASDLVGLVVGSTTHKVLHLGMIPVLVVR